MACGLPVVATDVGGIKEILLEEYGCLVPPNKPDVLATAVLELTGWCNNSRRDDLRARVEEKFSWETNIESLARIYEELI
jgi:glycosyltransferase involved in cell wall biosynthesis